MINYAFEIYFSLNVLLGYVRFNPDRLLTWICCICGIIMTKSASSVCARLIQLSIAVPLVIGWLKIIKKTSSRNEKYLYLILSFFVELLFLWEGPNRHISAVNLIILFLCFFGEYFDEWLHLLIVMVSQSNPEHSANEKKVIPDNGLKDEGILTPGKLLRQSLGLQDDKNNDEIHIEEIFMKDVLGHKVHNPSKKAKK